MMSPSDSLFQFAKLVKLGSAQPSFEILKLAEWMKSIWKVELLAADLLVHEGFETYPSLRLVFDEYTDVSILPVQIEERQAKIGLKYKELTLSSENVVYQIPLQELTISYYIFSEVSIQDCISKLDTQKLIKEFEQYDLWTVRIFNKTIIIFYQTRKELKQFVATGVDRLITKRVLELVKENDEFNYLKPEDINVVYDCKETFDKMGSWHAYFR